MVEFACVAEVALGLLASGGMANEGPAGANAPRREYQWVILVARDQSDLYAHLRNALRGDPKVQVTLDRRDSDSRNQPWSTSGCAPTELWSFAFPNRSGRLLTLP